MTINLELIYSKLPVIVQNALLSIKGYQIEKKRYSKTFHKILKESIDREFYSQDLLTSYQNQRLKDLFLAAFKSKFWSDIFSQYDVNLEIKNPIVELKKLPVLDKHSAKKYCTEILPLIFRKKDLHSCHTSGTTGSGLQFWETAEAENEQWAIWWRYRMRHAIKPNTWCMYFGGRSVVPANQKKPPFWRVNYPGKQIFFSAYHLNEESAIQYVKKLRESKCSWIHGYPSFIARLAQLKLGFDREPFENLKWITVGAESLLQHQKEIIKEAFGVKVIQHYGLREAVANISECEYGTLHVDEDFSLVEFLPVQNTEYYRIIGTNWSNPAFPLFRYDTGDLCRLILDKKCPCGRETRIVEEIDGRKEDFVILPNGCYIGRLDHIFKDLLNIREAQIMQSSTNQVEFRIVPGPNYDRQSDEKQLLSEAQKRLGSFINISINYVNSIPRTSSGKLRFVISNIKEAQNG